jgi:hypothetical protein
MKAVVCFTVNTLGSLKGREITTQNANVITSSAAVDKEPTCSSANQRSDPLTTRASESDDNDL